MSVEGSGSLGEPTTTATTSPGLHTPALTAASTANQTMSSVVSRRSTTTGVMPQATESCRATLSDGVAAMIGAVGR